MATSPGKIIDANPPANIDAEKAVLGAMILDPGAIENVCTIIKPQCFFHTRNRQLFEAIIDIHERGDLVDFMTLADEIKRRKQLDEIGGPAYIASLEQHIFSTANAAHHAKLVLRKHQLRELIRISQEIQEEAYNERDDVDNILDHAEKLIFDLSEQRTTREFVGLDQLLLDTIDEIDQRSSSSHELTGVATGYDDLDNWTGGFQKSDLLILAARPSMGKTAFALNIALNVGAGLRNRHIDSTLARPVGIFSLEMGATQITQRLLSTFAEVPMHQMRTGKLGAREKERLHKYARQLHAAPIFVDDTPGISVLELRAKARRLKATHKDLSLIIIDYLQLMHGSGRTESRQQEVAEITRSLKALARELQLPIVALSQLSRLIEQRKGKNQRPVLSDLRESGAIEQDADVVMFIHREKQLDRKDGDEEDMPPQMSTEPAELIIGKQRNGPIGIIDLVFFKETATFHTFAKNFEDTPGF